MADSIKVRLAVDGETKFKSAMKQASDAIKTVDSRLKVATEDFKKNGDAQKYAEQRGKILQEEIRRQSEVVSALRGALQEATTTYGRNSAQALRWEGELNRATVKLNQMQGALHNNNLGLDEAGRAFNSADKQAGGFNDTLKDTGEIAKNTKFTATIQAVQTLSRGFESAARTVTRYAKNAWGLVADASDWADELSTTSAQTGISVEDLQRWDYAADKIDTDVSTIIGAFAKLANTSTTQKDALSAIGVSTWKRVPSGTTTRLDKDGNTITLQRYHNAQKTANELFWDTVDALGAVNDAAKRDAVTNEIFGKSYLELIPLIKEGRAAWEKAGKEAPINSAEQVSALADFNDKLNTMNATISALKIDLAEKFAPAASSVADAVTALAGAAREYMASDAGQKAIGNITGFLNSAAQFAINNPEEAIKGTVSALLGLNALKLAPNLAQTLLALRLFGKSGGKGAKNAVDTAASAAGGAAASAGSGVVKKGFVKIASLAKGALAAASPYLGFGATVYAGSYALDKIATERDYGDFNRIYDAGGFKRNIENAASSIYNETIAALIAGMDRVDEGEGGDKLIDIFHTQKYQKILRSVLPDFDSLLEGMDETGNYAMTYQYAADAALKLQELANAAGTDAMKDIKAGIEGEVDVVTGAAEKAGESTALGFAAGIQAKIAAVQASVARMMAIAAPVMSLGAGGTTTNNNSYNNSRTVYIDQVNTARSFEELQDILYNRTQYESAAYGQ